MTKILVTRAIPGVLTVPGAEVIIGPDAGYLGEGELRAFVREHAPIDALVTMVHDRVDADLLDAAGDALKVVCNFAVGYDNIDVPACAARSVAVCNTPYAVTEGTADVAWALLLSAARRVHEGRRHIESGAYARRGVLGMREMLGVDIAGRTLLIVGAGRIGYATALRSIGWGMRVLYVARRRHFSFEFAPLNATRIGLDEGLAEADFISLHTPLTDQTRHLINADRLRLVKPTAVLVNTARGPVVDERALIDALREGRLFAAGLDVHEHEPDVPAELVSLPNVVLTPHVGSGARRYREMMTEIVAANIHAILTGADPVGLVFRPATQE